MKPIFVLLLGIFCYGCASQKVGVISGTWVLDSSTYNLAFIPSFCDSLMPGSKFVFSDGKLDVYKNGSRVKCNSMELSYQADSTELTLWEDDMVMDLGIVKLMGQSMVLHNRFVNNKVPIMEDTAIATATHDGYNTYFRRVD